MFFTTNFQKVTKYEMRNFSLKVCIKTPSKFVEYTCTGEKN